MTNLISISTCFFSISLTSARRRRQGKNDRSQLAEKPILCTADPDSTIRGIQERCPERPCSSPSPRVMQSSSPRVERGANPRNVPTVQKRARLRPARSFHHRTDPNASAPTRRGTVRPGVERPSPRPAAVPKSRLAKTVLHSGKTGQDCLPLWH